MLRADLYYGSMRATLVTKDTSVWLTVVLCTLNPHDLKRACTVNLVSSLLQKTFLTFVSTQSADGAAAPAEEAPKKKKKKKAIAAGEQAAADVARAVVEKTEGEKKKKKKKKATDA